MTNFAAKFYRDVFIRSEWNIGLVHAPIHSFLDPDFRPEIHWLPRPPDGTFVADPFGIVHGGRFFICCEEFDYGPHRGVISVAEVSDGGSISWVKTDLVLSVHMSYPHLVEHRGGVFCIPETFEAREAALYQAQDFPCRWVRIAALISDFAAVDSTVFRHDGRWWLTCTDGDLGPHDKLYLWHAQDLLGPWEPHPLNPVKTDLASARPAGTPFVHDGWLYRPAQDCSQTYGGRVVLNRVVRLTPTEFREESVGFVGPFADSPYPHGVHTVSAGGDITLIDAKRDRFIRRAFISAILRNRRHRDI